MIRDIKTLRLPVFPPTKKTRRIVTKHFTNLALYLERERFAMLNWLVYQCAVDNTIEYRHFLIEKYAMTIKATVDLYGSSDLCVTPQKLRKILQGLIEDGYILSLGEKTLLINPMLTYCEYLSKKQHQNLTERYGRLKTAEIAKFGEEYRKLADPNHKL